METYVMESYARQYQAGMRDDGRCARQRPLLYRLGALLIAAGTLLQRGAATRQRSLPCR